MLEYLEFQKGEQLVEKLKNDNIRSLFLKYLLPSVTGNLSIGILVFIDTIFIGRGIGSQGLAALNTAIPAFTIYSSTGLLLGMGGATAAAVDIGRGNHQGKNKIFSHSVYLAISIGISFTLLQWLLLDEFTVLLGATDTLFPLVKDYLRVISGSTLFYLLPHTVVAFIRNDGNPNLPMIGMVVCGIVNILLDYIFIFIFSWGMSGAALATGLAQLSYFLVLLTHFFSKKNTLTLERKRLKERAIRRIFRIGLPSFLNETSMGIAIFAFNLVLFKIKGDMGVAAYSIILNVNFLIYLIFVGISQACQPLISINYGAGNHARVKETLKFGYISTLIVSLATFLVVYFLKFPLISLFNTTDIELIEFTAIGMPIYFSSVLFMGINIMLAIFFQAVEYSGLSSLITFLRGLVLIILGLIVLPKFIGVTGVWATPLFAETLTLIIAVFLYKRFKYTAG